MSLILLSLLSNPAIAETVVVPVDSVLGDKPEQPEQPAVGWMVSRSTTTIRPAEELTHVRLDITLQATAEAVWVELRILDGQVMLTDEAGLERRNGDWWFTGKLEGQRTLVVEGVVPSTGNSVALAVPPAVRQEIRTQGEGLDFVVDGAVDGFLPSTHRLRVSWSPERPAVAKREVVQASVTTATWYEDNGLALRSKVRLAVRRGKVSRFNITLPRGLTEIDVTSPGATWQVSGNTLVLVSDKPIEGALDVTVQGRLPFSGKAVTVTQLEPQGVSSSTWTLTLAGTSEALLSPAVSGLHSTALSALPPNARSIGDAPPVAAWTGRGTLVLTALQLESLDGPALVIDRALCTEATSSSGRALLRCRMDVRNASAQFLRVKPPEGMVLWSAQVNGEGVAPVTTDSWTAVPLERSVETLMGLTQLDLDLTFMADEDVWARKGHRDLELPAFDAPVALLEWELRLPPGYVADIEGGSTSILREADAQIVYATASVDVKEEKDQARDTWNMALDSYQENDFELAQDYIDETLRLDPEHESALALQTNLDVFSGADDGRYDTVEEEAMSRKVKETARAKVADREVEEGEALEEADRLMMAGDYERAEEAYREAAEISDELAQYEQVESRENTYRAKEARKKADQARERDQQKQSVQIDLEDDTGFEEPTRGRPQRGTTGGKGTKSMPAPSAAPPEPEPDSSFANAPQEVEVYYDEDLDTFAIEGDESVVGALGSGAGPSVAGAIPEEAMVVGGSTTRTHGFGDAKPSPAPPPSPSMVYEDRPTLQGRPDLAATTLAIPLPEHGEAVVLTQRLLASGEAPTVTLKYRQKR